MEMDGVFNSPGMSIDLPLLERICRTPGAPGFEKRIRDLILKELKDGKA